MGEKEQEKKNKKVGGMKVILTVVGVILLLFVVLQLFGPSKLNMLGKDDFLTTAQLEKAINISELSTAEFIYNGVAEIYKDDKKEKVECYIAYDANVKVGIEMQDVKFNIDENRKVITPVLPKISVNIATLDPDSLGYMPKDPDIELQDAIVACEDDAINEANNSPKLYETAAENLQSVIEALLSPIIKQSGYTIEWATENETESTDED